MSLIFVEFIMLVEQYREGASQGFWKINSELMEEWRKGMIKLGYAHLIRFYQQF
jgi:hypothetical protein